jgi:hypothetical protein
MLPPEEFRELISLIFVYSLAFSLALMVYIYNYKVAMVPYATATVISKTSASVATSTSTTQISSATTIPTATETVIVKQARNRRGWWRCVRVGSVRRCGLWLLSGAACGFDELPVPNGNVAMKIWMAVASLL